MRFLLVLITFVSLPYSCSRADQQEIREIEVIAYNVHLLPKVASNVAGKRSNGDYRAKAIGEQIAQYDILGISEAFDPAYSQTLIETLQVKSSEAFTLVKGPGRSGRHLISSGLLLATRYPVSETHTVTYSHASRFITSGFKADGFAAKGALHARIQIGEHPTRQVDLFLTHMESRSSDARDRQIEQFAKFFKQHSTAGVPAILMGDFNVEAGRSSLALDVSRNSQYLRLVGTLQAPDRILVDAGKMVTSGPQGTSDAIAHDGGRRIDYVFLSQQPPSHNCQLRLLGATNLPMLDLNVPEGSLSDHLGVVCRFRPKWGEKPILLPKPNQR